jgi:plastocyanin
MSKQAMIIGAVVVVLLVGGGIYLSNKNSTPAPTPVDQTQVTTESSPAEVMSIAPEASGSNAPTASGTPATSGQTKQITVEGSNFKFVPNTISVNKGDTVQLTFKNSGGMHDFVIDELNVHSKVIQSGASDTVTFTASQTGTFQYYCSVDGHRAMGMVGTLTVK